MSALPRVALALIPRHRQVGAEADQNRAAENARDPLRLCAALEAFHHRGGHQNGDHVGRREGLFCVEIATRCEGSRSTRSRVTLGGRFLSL